MSSGNRPQIASTQRLEAQRQPSPWRRFRKTCCTRPTRRCSGRSAPHARLRTWGSATTSCRYCSRHATIKKSLRLRSVVPTARARALPRAPGRNLRVDPLRRRYPPLHRPPRDHLQPERRRAHPDQRRL